MKNSNIIPVLKEKEIELNFLRAYESKRKRFPKIIHNKGDYNNKVFNFMLYETYMQPHLHPGKEKTEKMHLISGSFALLYFNDLGEVIKKQVLDLNGKSDVNVPPFTWHTYIMLSDSVIVYETMEGIYNEKTWKKMAPWAPLENTTEAKSFYSHLRKIVS